MVGTEPFSRVYVFVFEPASWPRWRFRPLVREHVYCLTWQGQRWVKLDWTVSGPRVSVLETQDVVDIFTHHEAHIIASSVREPVFPLPIWTCVQMCKRIAGCRLWWIQTPRAFRNWLRRRRNEEPAA